MQSTHTDEVVDGAQSTHTDEIVDEGQSTHTDEVVDEGQSKVDVFDAETGGAESFTELILPVKEHFHLNEEMIMGSEVVLTQSVPEKVAESEVTMSEALAMVCDSEVNTEAECDLVDSKKTECTEVHVDPEHKSLTEDEKANKVDHASDQEGDHSYAAQENGSEEDGGSAHGQDFDVGEVKGDQVERMDMNALQEGMKNIDMKEKYTRSNSEEYSGNDDDEASGDQIFEPDNEDLSENDFLGDDDDLSEVCGEEEKLLAGSSKQVEIDNNSSSGASALYSHDGAPLEGGNNEDGAQVRPDESTGQEEVEKVIDPVTESSIGVTSQSKSSEKLPSFPSAFGHSESQQQGVMMMQTVIHPPGTNIQMQQLMKSRLPSTSSVSDAEVSPAVEKIIEKRMGMTQTFPSSSSPAAMSVPPTKLSQAVLKPKDPNVMERMQYGPPKGKPLQSTQLQSSAATQMVQGTPTNTEEESDEP